MKKKMIITALAMLMSASVAHADVATVTKDDLGTFEITAYSYNEGNGENYYTASQRNPVPYYTVAVDPNIIPLGTHLYIEGIGEVRADDTGGAVKGRVIDYHVGYDETDSFGRQHKKVYIIK
jgi:3D (Asp-Asp-Asp) domain-containing protein